MDDVISTIQASTSVQEEKVVSIENVNSSIEQFVEDTNAIDGKVADLVDKRKDDFYEQYNYLKPECEKSNWEKFCDDLEDIGEWCKEHWKEILKVVAIIVIAIVVVATGGFAALLPLLAAALKGALIGAAIGGIIGGISNMLQGGSFFAGFLKGAIEGAIDGALFGEIGVVGQMLGHSCKVLNIMGKLAKTIPKIAIVSGITSLSMLGFDMLSLAVSVFDPKNPLVQFNQKLHKNGLYNAFQFSVNVVATFTGGFIKGMKNPICFVAGTMVLTVAGLRAIETIKAGEKVIATNPKTDQSEEKTVVETYINQTECIVHLHINNEVIDTTKNHPFFVKDKGFVVACDLTKGDEIINSSGRSYPVEQIEFEEKQETVYNFQVEDFHTYYVGESRILVHNSCGPSKNGSEGSSASVNLPEYDGKTTHGVLVLDDGTQVPFSSGNANPEYRNYIPASHVEGKAAIYMRENGVKGGTVFHNNTDGTCPYCDKMLPTLLEEGTTLKVVPPSNAVAPKPSWVDTVKTYVGNDKIPKKPK